MANQPKRVAKKLPKRTGKRAAKHEASYKRGENRKAERNDANKARAAHNRQLKRDGEATAWEIAQTLSHAKHKARVAQFGESLRVGILPKPVVKPFRDQINPGRSTTVRAIRPKETIMGYRFTCLNCGEMKSFKYEFTPHAYEAASARAFDHVCVPSTWRLA